MNYWIRNIWFSFYFAESQEYFILYSLNLPSLKQGKCRPPFLCAPLIQLCLLTTSSAAAATYIHTERHYTNTSVCNSSRPRSKVSCHCLWLLPLLRSTRTDRVRVLGRKCFEGLPLNHLAPIRMSFAAATSAKEEDESKESNPEQTSSLVKSLRSVWKKAKQRPSLPGRWRRSVDLEKARQDHSEGQQSFQHLEESREDALFYR